jgi:hypothetical protein
MRAAPHWQPQGLRTAGCARSPICSARASAITRDRPASPALGLQCGHFRCLDANVKRLHGGQRRRGAVVQLVRRGAVVVFLPLLCTRAQGRSVKRGRAAGAAAQRGSGPSRSIAAVQPRTSSRSAFQRAVNSLPTSAGLAPRAMWALSCSQGSVSAHIARGRVCTPRARSGGTR